MESATPAEVAARIGVSPGAVRAFLRSVYGPLPAGQRRWILREGHVFEIERHFAPSPEPSASPYQQFASKIAPPPFLFHYTGPAGLLGICQSRTLWAGRASEMNDFREQRIAWDILEGKLADFIPNRRPGSVALHAALCKIVEGASRNRYQLPTVYTVSLAPEGDSLGLWRGYAPRSGGVSIGFPGHVLRQRATAQGYLLAPCLYSYRQHVGVVNDILDHHYRALLPWMDFEPPDDVVEAFARGIRDDLVQYGAFLKDSSFAEEDEWRLVSPPDPAVPLVRSPGVNGIKVFAQFELGPSNGLLFDDEDAEVQYVIGPNVDQAAMLQTVGGLFAETFTYYNGWTTSSTYR